MGEEEDGTGRKVFKDYENRHDREDFVISDCDPGTVCIPYFHSNNN